MSAGPGRDGALTDPVLREVFVLWPAWGTLVEYVSRTDARDADPASIYGCLCAADRDRLAALLFAHRDADSLEEATALLDELVALAREGRRPRFGRELGLVF